MRDDENVICDEKRRLRNVIRWYHAQNAQCLKNDHTYAFVSYEKRQFEFALT